MIDLVRDNWSKEDIVAFHEYGKSLKGSDKDCEWEKRIINTSLECFGKTSTKAREAVSQIKKGNYVEFLRNIEITNHFESVCYAHLISCIKDKYLFRELLDKFVLTIDNWASSDTIRFSLKDTDFLLQTAIDYLESDMPFVRRTGLNILLSLAKKEQYINVIFTRLDMLKNEKEYYVNMCAAWVLSECFIHHRDATLRYYSDNHTNAFIINKSISKCHDSFRVSPEDKEFLKSFKKKD